MATPRPPISKLSVDHFSIIAEYLEKRDIQSARLSGPELHFFLSPYLFRSIRFAPHQDCLNLIDTVSHDDVLSSNVRTLRFDSSLFTSSMEEEEFDAWE